MGRFHHWVRALVLVPVGAAFFGCGSGVDSGEESGESRQALVAPTNIGAFVLLASGRITIQDRTQVSGGDVGAAATTGDAINTTSATTIALGRATIGPRIVLGDQTAAGNLFVNQLVAPHATFTSQNPFVAPPVPPAIPAFSAGSAALTVNGGQTVTRAAGSFGQVTVNGTLNLSGGTYQIQNITLGPDGAIVATGPSLVEVAGKVSGADRSRLVGNANAGALRLFVAGTTDTTGGVVLGNDARLTALVVSRAQFRAGDRLIASGAVAARDIALAHDSRFTFNTGFGCNTDASCNDNNGCTTDTCVEAQCRHTNVANGTACSDGNACTTADSCQAGACVSGTGINCDDHLFCTGTETCNPATGCVAGTPPASDDGVACTVDACNEASDHIDHTPNDGLCPSGFACNAAAGCQDIDECAAGTANCDVNATCTNSAGGFTCACKPGYTGDGKTCVEECKRITVGNGIERCVVARQDGTIDMYLNPADLSTPWDVAGQFEQNDPPYENGCGPIAGRNLLIWYGMDSLNDDDALWNDIGSAMHVNTWDDDKLSDACCPDLCVPATGICTPNPACQAACDFIVGETLGAVINLGTLPEDVLPVLDARVPPGYVRCNDTENLSLPQLQWSLSRGNPVYFLGSEGSTNLHWAVATGIRKEGNDFKIRIANLDADLTVAGFEHYRSLDELFFSSASKFFLDETLGIRPYVIRYAKATDVLPGNICDDWHSNDLTNAATTTGGQTTGSSAIVGYETAWNSQHHIDTIGDDRKVHEYFYSNLWTHNNLTDAATTPTVTVPLVAPGSALAGYVSTYNTNQQHVIFLSEDGHVNELFFTENDDAWHYADLTARVRSRGQAAPNAMLTSPLVAYQTAFNSQQHVFFLTADGHIHELFFADNDWSWNDLTQGFGFPEAQPTSPLVGFVTSSNQEQHLDYVSQSNGHLNELFFAGGTWNWADSTARVRMQQPSAPAPKTGSPLTGYETLAGGIQQQHIDFVGDDGHVHEYFFFNGDWEWRDLFVDASVPGGTAPTGALHGYATTYNVPQQHVNFTSSNGHVYELFHDTSWHFRDLSAIAAPLPPPARLTSQLTGYQTTYNSEQHVGFIASDGRVYELFL